MYRRYSNALTIIIVCIVLLSCSKNEDIDSSDLRTSGMYAAIEIHASADNAATVEATLKAGGADSNTYVDLSAGDSLTATLNSNVETHVLAREEHSGIISYKASFTGAGAGVENSTYTVALERSDGVDAPNSTISVPAGVSALATSPLDSFSRASDNLTISWTGSVGITKKLKVSGSCIKSETYDVAANPTSYTINAGLLKQDPLSSTTSCTITVAVELTTSGTLDPAYGEGGYIRATRSVSTTISSGP